MIRIMVLPRGGRHKLAPRWCGPRYVTKVHRDGETYTLDNDKIINYDRLKIYKPRMSDLKLKGDDLVVESPNREEDPYLEVTPELRPSSEKGDRSENSFEKTISMVPSFKMKLRDRGDSTKAPKYYEESGEETEAMIAQKEETSSDDYKHQIIPLCIDKWDEVTREINCETALNLNVNDWTCFM